MYMFPMVRGWSYVESCISVAPSWSLGHGVDERGDSWGSVVVRSRLATIIERLDWFTMFTIVVEYGNQAKSPYTCSCLVHVRVDLSLPTCTSSQKCCMGGKKGVSKCVYVYVCERMV